MSTDEARDNVPQVTNYDHDAEALARFTEALPQHFTTALAYMEAVKLRDELLRRIEGFEKSAAFKRLTGAQ